jgi:hypothetical protein
MMGKSHSHDKAMTSAVRRAACDGGMMIPAAKNKFRVTDFASLHAVHRGIC